MSAWQLPGSGVGPCAGHEPHEKSAMTSAGLWTVRSAFPLAFMLSACLLLAACQEDPGRKMQGAQAQGASAAPAARFTAEGLTGGELILEEDFEGKGLPKSLKPHGKARVVDGWLRLQNIKNEPPVWVDQKLPENVRVEFDARALTAEGDIKVEIFGDGSTHQSGYILVYGAHKNKEDWFARLDEHGADRITRQTVGVEKDKTYRWAIVRTDGRVRWFVDGEPFLMFDDKEPLTGDQHAWFAFNNWAAPVEFDNLKIYEL